MLTDSDLHLLISALCVNNNAKHSSNLKFGKLMLSTVLAYSSKVLTFYFIIQTFCITWILIWVYFVIEFYLELAVLLLFFYWLH